ncbi:metal ABC transporter substrate-binding protein [Formosa sp. PL04]|uniref:metal ABC transporter substrate-binding protein n=1 Tax=Formosa sp. PL04 TaxID=3081755 RepID=UPI002981E4D2|nr:metal ABC transporter substrate-binding protein [Formosa sp. PL04]MDW5287485.1 metal ABC transporter substrate-binding protein [Formosa sp. PL04]
MRIISIFILGIVFCLSSCKKENKKTTAKASQGTPVVYVTNYPLYYFANRIGGEVIDLHFPASELIEPAIWKPETDTIVAMQQADFIFINGAYYEKWLMNVSLPENIIVNTGASFEDKLLGNGEVFSHSHGENKTHLHTETAYTTWLDLAFANKQAEAIKNTLSEKYPELEDTFNSNFKTLSNELLELDMEFRSVGSQMQEANIAVLFSHPVYQYFQKAYGIKGESLHWEPYDNIDQDKLQEIVHLTKHQNINTLVWEAAPKTESAITLEKHGIKSVIIAPLSGEPNDGDFLSVMIQNLNTLKGISLP